MYERVKDQRAWQLEQGRELSTLREKVDAAQDTGVANCILDNQTALGLASLDGRVETLEGQGRFLLDSTIAMGLYDNEVANTFLEKSMRYTAMSSSLLYDHVVALETKVRRLVSSVTLKLINEARTR